ncbi:YtxH domain-containing protein [Bacillus sp. FJAT-42376]|uniref:YtxH domain-containing protein n=1 Tax=Bacillus sp. FJAT-42376 TaxID=2014076 RepID=UPI000F5086BB|nr:YtxH domain-containing protein [Bacillus sp. FJAT-42376]AZB43973.1 YtxH domain-containing protein [Bacillus sp. FJAT-42376]
MSKDGINSKDFMIGTLIGGIVGASAALLLAPKSGKDLRGDIGSQANMVAEKTNKMTNDALGKSSEWANKAKEKTASLSQTVSMHSNQLMSKVKDIRGGEKTADQDPLDAEISAIDELADEAAASTRPAAFDSQENVLQEARELAEKEASKTSAEPSGITNSK